MGDGWAAKCAFDSALPFDTNSIPFELSPSGETVALKETIVNTGGMFGTRSQRSERSRNGQQVVSGTINFEVSPALLDFILPMILGANEATDVFAVADTLQTFQFMVDRIAKVFTYPDLVVSKATFRGSSGGFLTLAIDVIGTSETVGNSGTFPALSNPLDPPYIFEDGVLTLGGTTYSMFDFELVIDNKVQSRFANSLTATRNSPTDLREVTLSVTNPFTSSETGLYDPSIAGIAGSLVFTNGNGSVTFTLPCLQAPAESPTVTSKGEIPLKINYVARMTSTTREISVTNDSTLGS